MPTVKALLAEARDILEAADVEDSRLDARLLLQHATGLRHDEIIAEPALIVEPPTAQLFFDLVMRRAAHEPVSRILGSREFFGRVFKVTPAVLDPRSDTETVIEACLTLPRPKRILDLGTGSGILCVTLLAEFPDAAGVAVDVSDAALAVARANAKSMGVADRLELVHSSWFSAVEGKFDLIVSNPPYIPSRDISGLDVDVRHHDPHVALDGGSDGLGPYREISAKAAGHLNPQAHVMVEIGAGQAYDVTSIFGGHRFSPAGQWLDLGGHVRALAFNKP